MAPTRSLWQTRAGLAGYVFFIALIVVAVLRKGPWPSDGVYILVRWPLWLVPGLGVPALLLRLMLWGRLGSGARRGPAAPDGDRRHLIHLH